MRVARPEPRTAPQPDRMRWGARIRFEPWRSWCGTPDRSGALSHRKKRIRRLAVNRIIYIVGLVVIVVAIVGFVL